MKLKGNQAGFTLVEVLVGAAMLGGLSLGVAQLMKNMNEDQAQGLARDELRTLGNMIAGHLGNVASCRETVRAPMTPANAPDTMTTSGMRIPSILKSAGVPVYSINDRFGKLIIQDMKLRNYNNVLKKAELEIVVSFNKSSTVNMTRSQIIPINADINTVAGTVIQCAASTAGLDGLWKMMPIPLSGVFYNQGSVLVGSGEADTGSSVPAMAFGSTNNVYAPNAIAAGLNNSIPANSLNGVALGSNNDVGGAQSVAIGSDNNVGSVAADGGSAVALGYSNFVSKRYGMALGYGHSISSEGGFALGNFNSVSGGNAFGIGTVVEASADYAVGIGNDVSAKSLKSLAIGFNVIAESTEAISIGTDVTNRSGQGVSIGKDISVDYIDNAIAIGKTLSIGGTSHDTIAIGNDLSIGTLAMGSVAIGERVQIFDNAMRSISIGSGSKVEMQRAISIGENADSRQQFGLAIGADARSFGNSSIALGNGSTALSQDSIAIGKASNAAQWNAISIGLNSAAVGLNGIAIGNVARTNSGIAIGYASESTDTGGSSAGIAIGEYAKALGAVNSIAIGNGSIAGMQRSIAIGPFVNNTMASSIAISPDAGSGVTAAIPSTTNVIAMTARSGFELCFGAIAGVCEPTKLVKLIDPAGSWIYGSDKNLKKDIKPVDKDKVLSNFVELDISTWRYKTSNESNKNIGPMAQDFYRLFTKPLNLKGDDKTLAPNNLFMVSAIATQALHEKVLVLEKENQNLKSELQLMRESVCEINPKAKVCGR